MDLSLIAFAYLAGNAATVNPCGFAMLPAFATFVIGDADADGAPVPVGLRLWRAVRLGATVSVAFIAVFAATGLVFSFVSRQVVAVVPWLAVAVGGVLFLYGLAVAAGRGKLTLRLPNPAEGRANNRSALLFGVGYAIASLSCTLPVFLTVVAGTLATGGVASGVGGFVAYGVGMGTIVFAVAISMALARDGLVGWLRRSSRHLERVSGGVLALAGAYLLLYWGYALGPGRRPTLDSSAPAPVAFVTRLADTAGQYLATPLGRGIVALLAVGVLAAIAIGLVARRRSVNPATATRTPTEECSSCPPTTTAPEPADHVARGTGR
jgi:cytochrome c-type biogenesis protein